MMMMMMITIFFLFMILILLYFRRHKVISSINRPIFMLHIAVLINMLPLKAIMSIIHPNISNIIIAAIMMACINYIGASLRTMHSKGSVASVWIFIASLLFSISLNYLSVCFNYPLFICIIHSYILSFLVSPILVEYFKGIFGNIAGTFVLHCNSPGNSGVASNTTGGGSGNSGVASNTNVGGSVANASTSGTNSNVDLNKPFPRGRTYKWWGEIANWVNFIPYFDVKRDGLANYLQFQSEKLIAEAAFEKRSITTAQIGFTAENWVEGKSPNISEEQAANYFEEQNKILLAFIYHKREEYPEIWRRANNHFDNIPVWTKEMGYSFINDLRNYRK